MPKSNVILTQDQATKLQQIYNIIIPLPASGWTSDTAPFSQQISVGGITDAQMGEMFLQPAGDTPTEAEETAYTALDNAESGDGYILFKTKDGVTTKPTTDITVRLTGLTTPGDTTAAGVAGMQAEIEDLKENSTPVYGIQITPLNGYEFDESYTYINKVGKIVEIQIYIITAFDSDNKTIGNVPKEARPKRQVWFPVFAANGGEYVGRLMVTQTGDVTIVDTARKLEGVMYLNGRTMYVI